MNFRKYHSVTYILKKHALFFSILLSFFAGPIKLKAQSDITVTGGDVVNTPAFPASTCSYGWTNDNPSIGLAASGIGNIPSFTATNPGILPIKATITYSTVPVNYYAYVGTPSEKSLAMLNLATGKEENRVNINSSVYGIAITKDGSRIYTTDEYENFVNVYDAVNKKLLPPIPIPSFGWGLAFSPNEDKLYVGGGGFYIIDVATSAVSLTKLSGTSRSSFLISPDGKTVYGRALYDLPSKTSTRPIGFAVGYDFIYNADKTKIYFSRDPVIGAATGGVRIYDIATQQFDDITLDGPGGNIVLSQDGKTLYVDKYFTTLIYVIDVASKTVIKKIDTQTHHRGISFGLDGSKLFVINFEDGLTAIDTKTYEVTKTKFSVGGDAALLFGKFTTTGSCYNNPVTFTITVNPPSPVLTATGTLAAVSIVYGTETTPTSFTVSGDHLPTGIIITPPAGYEASTDGITYGSTLTVGSPGTVVPTKVYLRLKLTAGAGSYSGNVVLTSGAAGATLPTVSSTITPAPLIITAGITKKYGDVLTNAVGSINFTAIGLKNNETIGGVSIAYGTGAAAADAVGTYSGTVTTSAPIGGTFSPANYTITYPQSNIIVVAVPLTITADNKERSYGEANPVLTYKYSGFVNNEGATQLTSLPVISTVAVPASPVGQYPITISGAAAANYTFKYVPGTLTVIPTVVTIATAFTPNGDGINDTWEIKKIGQYPKCTVEVMNRYGEKIFYSIGYPIAWNGTFSGANLPTGTYYYIIRLTSSTKPLTGYLAIIR